MGSRLYSVVAVLILASAVLVSASFADADSDDAYTIKGKVTSDGTTPLGGIMVNLNTSDWSRIVETDSSGQYSITSPVKDDLTISFIQSGKTVTAYNSQYMRASGDSFSLTLDSSLTVFDLGSITMEDTYLNGYLVCAASNGNIPFSDCEINIEDAFGNNTSAVTDENGRFSIEVGSVYGLSMSLSTDGYTAIPGISFMSVDNSGTIHFSLRGTIPDLGMNYSIPYSDTGGNRIYEMKSTTPIVVTASTGSAVLYISNSKDVGLQGGTVTMTLVSDPTVKYVSHSDSDGEVVFKDMTTGTYEFEIRVPGFEGYDGGDVDITKGSNVVGSFILKESESTDYFGLSLSHLMMIVGVVIGIVLILITALLYSRHDKIGLDSEDEE